MFLLLILPTSLRYPSVNASPPGSIVTSAPNVTLFDVYVSGARPAFVVPAGLYRSMRAVSAVGRAGRTLPLSV